MKMTLLKRASLFAFCLALGIGFSKAQNVGINADGSAPDGSAIFDVKSTSKGMLIPRMGTNQRTAIVNPAKGLLVYDTTANSFWYYKTGTGWSEIASPTNGALTLPYAAVASSTGSLFSLTNAGTGNGIAATSSTGVSVRGTIVTGTSDIAVGVQGEVGNQGSTGKAGRFINTNATNTIANTLEVVSASNGNITDNSMGNASSFLVNNSISVAAAVRGEINTVYGNFGAAGVFGKSTGTGGAGGLFHASNPMGNATALIAMSDGNGAAIAASAAQGGTAILTSAGGTANALAAYTDFSGTGKVASFQNYNASNTSDVVSVSTLGNSIFVNSIVNNANGTSAAIKGEINSVFANFEIAGVYGLASGTGGKAGLFYASNPNGVAPGIIAITEGQGTGVIASAGKDGNGVEASCSGTGNAVYGWTPTFSAGKAARFVNFNTSNTNSTVNIINQGIGAALVINHTGSAGNIAVYQNVGTNVARIDKTGRGFFNGGTQTGGADLAEAFDTEGSTADYEPGDVLIISVTSDRAIEKSAAPYSTLVAGVYATKPGVLLTEENIDSQLTGKVPMGVVGVIPTKVCLEGGIIQRGDLLVTSSLKGVAMKADINQVKPGQVIGKALANFNSTGTGKINVLVNVK